jgi:hypothetical protein
MQLEQFHRLQGKLMFAHFGTLSPIVDRIADGGRSKIAAPDLVFGDPAQRSGP